MCIVKVLNPGFFAREDMRTPVWIALAALIVNIALNLYGRASGYGIVGLAARDRGVGEHQLPAALHRSSHRRGWFHFTASLASRIARQLVAVAAMSALLWWMMPMLKPYYGGGVFDRIWSLAALVGAAARPFSPSPSSSARSTRIWSPC